MARRNRLGTDSASPRSTDPEASPVIESSSAIPEAVVDVPAPAAPAALAFVPERMVRIRNLTGQMIQCSVLSESGLSEALRLDARASSRPYREAAIDDYTRHLVGRGLLKIETAR